MFENLYQKVDGEGIRTAEWNQLAAAFNRVSGATFGSNVGGLHSGSIETSSAEPEWLQGIARVKGRAEDADGFEIAGRWDIQFRYCVAVDGETEDDRLNLVREWRTDETRTFQLDAAEFPGQVKVGDTIVVYLDRVRNLYVPILAGVKTFRVKNETGKRLRPFEVVGLSEPIHKPGTSEVESGTSETSDGGDSDPDREFKGDRGDMVAVVPQFPEHLSKWAIVTEALEVHEIGPAVISGVTIVRVRRDLFPRGKWANVIPGVTGELRELPYGRAEVVWADEAGEGGEWPWAVVNLGNMSAPLFGVRLYGPYGADPVTGVPGAECEVMLPDNSGVDPAATRINVADSLALVRGARAGDYAWCWFDEGTYQFEFVPWSGSDDGIQLFQTQTGFNWQAEGSTAPPTCYASKVKWNAGLGRYVADATVYMLYWPQASRDKFGAYARCAGYEAGRYVWARKQPDANRWEIVDGLVWTGMVRLYGPWSYAGTAPKAEAHLVYKAADGSFTLGTSLVDVYLTEAPKAADGSWIGLPYGGTDEPYTVTMEADSRYVVQAPYETRAVARLSGEWIEEGSWRKIEVCLHRFTGGGWSDLEKKVTAYYAGGPKSHDGAAFHVPLGPTYGKNQFCLVSYDYGKRKWTIDSLFDPQHVYRGTTEAAWKLGDAPVGVNVEGLVASVPAAGWAYQVGVVVPAETRVLVWYFPDEAGFYFIGPSQPGPAAMRGITQAPWHKGGAAIGVKLSDGSDVQATGWGFLHEETVPAMSPVLVWQTDNAYWFLADTSGKPGAVYLARQTGTWSSTVGNAPPSCSAKKLRWGAGLYETYDADLTVHWPGAPRANDGTYVVSGIANAQNVFWIAQTTDTAGNVRWEIIDGLNWCGYVSLAAAWDFHDGTRLPSANARMWLQNFGLPSQQEGNVLVYLADAPRDINGGWAGVPRGHVGEVYPVARNADGFYEAALPEVEVIGAIISTWTYNAASEHASATVRIMDRDAGGKYVQTSSAVTAVYAGLPRSSGGSFFEVPKGPPSSPLWQFCAMRYVRHATGDGAAAWWWEITSLFNAHQIFRGRVKAAWSYGGAVVSCKALDRFGTEYGNISAAGWGYQASAVVPYNTEVWLFYVSDEGRFYFFSAPPTSAALRGKLAATWKRGDGPVAVAVEGDGAIQATGWGFAHDNALPINTQVLVFFIDGLYWFIADTASNVDSAVYLARQYSAWSSPGVNSPPTCQAKKLRWGAGLYDVYGDALTVHWPTAPRGTDGKYMRSASANNQMVFWIAQQQDAEGNARWEVVDGTNWTGFAVLNSAWVYGAGAAPYATAKMWTQGGALYSEPGDAATVTVYLPQAPKAVDGEYAGFPKGRPGEVVVVSRNANGWYEAELPEVEVLGCLGEAWSYDDAARRATCPKVYLLELDATNKYQFSGKYVSAIYAGLPRKNDTGNYYQIPRGRAETGGLKSTNFCMLRYSRSGDAAEWVWEVVSLFEPYHNYRGRTKAEWRQGGVAVSCKVVDVDGNEYGTLDAAGWGYAAGAVVAAGTDVWLFFVAEESKFHFMSSGVADGAPVLFETTDEGSVAGAGANLTPPRVLAVPLQWDSDQEKYRKTSGVASKVTLHWAQAPLNVNTGLAGIDSTYSALMTCDPGMRLWAKMVTTYAADEADRESRWEIIGGPEHVFHARLQGYWEYSATEYNATPRAQAKLVWYDPGLREAREGNDEIVIFNPNAAPRIVYQDEDDYPPVGNYSGVPAGNFGDLYTVRLNYSGAWEVVAMRELVRPFSIEEGWSFSTAEQGGVPHAKASLYTSDSLSGLGSGEKQWTLEALGAPWATVRVFGVGLPRREDGNFLAIGPTQNREGVCMWSEGSDTWDVVSWSSGIYLFRMLSEWVYPIHPKAPYCNARLEYLNITTAAGGPKFQDVDNDSRNVIKVYAPDAPMDDAGGSNWAKVPVGKGSPRQLGWALWDGDAGHWKLVSMAQPEQVYRATIAAKWYCNASAQIRFPNGALATAYNWGYPQDAQFDAETKVFVVYDATEGKFYVMTPPGFKVVSALSKGITVTSEQVQNINQEAAVHTINEPWNSPVRSTRCP